MPSQKKTEGTQWTQSIQKAIIVFFPSRLITDNLSFTAIGLYVILFGVKTYSPYNSDYNHLLDKIDFDSTSIRQALHELDTHDCLAFWEDDSVIHIHLVLGDKGWLDIPKDIK